ncbi:MAG: anti-sigma-factor antagonist [Friedmanniella sp.]|nr:anti-sigma-factor antagonist [Friedmanniella sp.]
MATADPSLTQRPGVGTRATRDEPVRLPLDGRFDALAAAAVRPALTAALDRAATFPSRGLLLDLSTVTFVDSAGLAALVRLRKDGLARGVELVLVRPRHPEAVRVFALTRFDRVFAMVDAPVAS